jgi:outer membrane cobalamin receptor
MATFQLFQENSMFYYLLSALILCAVPAFSAISDSVHGHIMEKDPSTRLEMPVSGARIYWMGSNRGTLSSKDGSFSLARHMADKALIISMPGYKKDTVSGLSEHIHVVLRPDGPLQDIVVEDNAIMPITRATLRTEKIGSAKLEESACCSLAESFERSPSVEVSYSDAATGARQIQLLGLRGVYTQQLSEAVPSMRGLAQPYGMDYVPGAFLESISISKGAASVINGYEGLAGQINIEYLKSEKIPAFFLNLYANQMQRYEVNMASGFTIAPGWQAGIMAHGRSFQHHVDGNQDGYMDMPLFKQANIAFRLHHRSGNTEFQFFGKALSDQYNGGMDPEMHKDHAGADIFTTQTNTRRAEFFAKLGFMELDNEWMESLAFQASGAVHDMHAHWGSRTYAGLQDNLYLKMIAIAAVGEHKIWYGGSLLYDQYIEEFMNQPMHRREFVPGIYIEDTYTGINNLTLVGGIRADFHNLYGTLITPRIHARYEFSELASIRASAGRGMRVANLIADNFSAFASNRNIRRDSIINPEIAWNYGISGTWVTSFFDLPVTADAEFYRTVFSNQIIVDYDRSARDIWLINDKQSYANSAMLQMQINPWQSTTLSAAWRWNDLWQSTGGSLQRRALISPHRVLITLSQSFIERTFQLDISGIWNSTGRIPSTNENPENLRMAQSYPDFTRINAQFTWRTGDFDIYAGVENLTNTLQKHVVIDGMQPSGPYFDASLVWGPLDNRTIYAGIRLRLGQEAMAQ